jgi:tetratricopeptide (TPR) repeat protein
MEQEHQDFSEPRLSEHKINDLASLLECAHGALEVFDYETAQKNFLEAARNYPESEKALFEYGYFLYEQGDIKAAEELLLKAVALAPEKNAKKYFTLAQLSTQSTDVKSFYTKGLQLVFDKIELIKKNTSELSDIDEKLENLNRLAAQGFCGLAQLEATGEGVNLDSFNSAQFLNYIQKSIEIDRYYLEAYSQLSLYYFNVQDEASCRKTLSELVARVHELEDKTDSDLSEYGPGFFISIVRMMIEGEIWEDGIYLMEVGLQSNSKDLEGNYLYAFCLFKAEEFEQAADVCKEMEKNGIMKSGDEELIQGFVELKQEIKSAILNLPTPSVEKQIDSENEWMDDN